MIIDLKIQQPILKLKAIFTLSLLHAAQASNIFCYNTPENEFSQTIYSKIYIEYQLLILKL